MQLPKDPIILYSYVNTKLRNDFESLDDMCEQMGFDKQEIVEKLTAAGFEYCDKLNKFF